MMWQDVLLRTEAPEESLAEAIANGFHLEGEQVQLCDSVEAMPEPTEPSVCVVVSPLEGDFPVLMSIFAYGSSVEQAAVPAVVGRICTELEAQALVSDDAADPFTMILLGPRGERRVVSVDGDELAEGRYRIVKS